MQIISVNDIVNVNQKKQIMVVNNNSNESILLIGGCRITPFLNYLIHHDLFGNKYNYLCVLVYVPEMIQLSEEIIYNEKMKSQLFTSKILIAEYIQNYNYFNTYRLTEKCIFRVYDSFQHEIILPNWNDICIYAKDLINYKNLEMEFRQLLNGDITLPEFTVIIQSAQQKELDRYFKILEKAKMPWPYLKNFIHLNLNTYRLSYTLNHPTNMYSIEMYRLLIEHFFATSPYFLPQNLIDLNNKYEFLKTGVDTKLTYYDHVCLGYKIQEDYLDEENSNTYILDK